MAAGDERLPNEQYNPSKMRGLGRPPYITPKQQAYWESQGLDFDKIGTSREFTLAVQAIVKRNNQKA